MQKLGKSFPPEKVDDTTVKVERDSRNEKELRTRTLENEVCATLQIAGRSPRGKREPLKCGLTKLALT
jgi:hypothetical protein